MYYVTLGMMSDGLNYHRKKKVGRSQRLTREIRCDNCIQELTVLRTKVGGIPPKPWLTSTNYSIRHGALCVSYLVSPCLMGGRGDVGQHRSSWLICRTTRSLSHPSPLLRMCVLYVWLRELYLAEICDGLPRYQWGVFKLADEMAPTPISL